MVDSARLGAALTNARSAGRWAEAAGDSEEAGEHPSAEADYHRSMTAILGLNTRRHAGTWMCSGSAPLPF
jgi:hypothetical protein